MNAAESLTILETLTISVDTREQPTAKLQKRIKQIEGCGPAVQREKLDFGDYGCHVIIDGSRVQVPVVVERKMNLGELANCFCGQRGRFEREFQRAAAANFKTYLLVENQSIYDAITGRYNSRMSAKSMTGSIMAWIARYNCQIMFCPSEITGTVLYNIFHYETREYLNSLIDE